MKHAPTGYDCPFCGVARGRFDGWIAEEDVVLQDDVLTAFISPAQWPRNPGHAVIVPNQHYENLYDLPDSVGARIHAASRRIALAMKSVYACAGTSTRQHNEPAGNQEVWHYHLHVFPRFDGDRLYGSEKARVPAPLRAEQARVLRAGLGGGPATVQTTVSLESPFTAAASELFEEQRDELVQRYGDSEIEAAEPDGLRDERTAFVVVRLEDRPVGCGLLRPYDEKTGELKRMYIRPDARRGGLGRRLLALLESEARERGFQNVRLETGVLQPEAIELYESSGYRRIPRYGPWTDNPTSLCYEKDL